MKLLIWLFENVKVLTQTEKKFCQTKKLEINYSQLSDYMWTKPKRKVDPVIWQHVGATPVDQVQVEVIL